MTLTGGWKPSSAFFSSACSRTDGTGVSAPISRRRVNADTLLSAGSSAFSSPNRLRARSLEKDGSSRTSAPAAEDEERSEGVTPPDTEDVSSFGISLDRSTKGISRSMREGAGSSACARKSVCAPNVREGSRCGISRRTSLRGEATTDSSSSSISE